MMFRSFDERCRTAAKFVVAAALLNFSLLLHVHASQFGSPAWNGPLDSFTGSIRGHFVINGQERPLPSMVSVSLYAASGPLLGQITVQREPDFEFTRLRAGQYRIVVECPGFGTVEEEVWIQGGQDQRLMIALNREADKKSLPAGSGAVVSVRELRIPQKAMELFRKAMESASDPVRAIEYLEKAVFAFPGFYEAHNNLAVLFARNGQLEQAVHHLRKAVEIENGDPLQWKNLGLLLLHSQSFEEAEGCLRRSLGLKDEVDTRYLLGQALLGLGRLQQGVEELRQVQGQRNDDRMLYFQLAQVYSKLGRAADELSQLEGFLRLESEGPRADWVRGRIRQLRPATTRQHALH